MSFAWRWPEELNGDGNRELLDRADHVSDKNCGTWFDECSVRTQPGVHHGFNRNLLCWAIRSPREPSPNTGRILRGHTGDRNGQCYGRHSARRAAPGAAVRTQNAAKRCDTWRRPNQAGGAKRITQATASWGLRRWPAVQCESGQGQNRTGDTRIFSPLLYRLSYLTKSFGINILRQ